LSKPKEQVDSREKLLIKLVTLRGTIKRLNNLYESTKQTEYLTDKKKAEDEVKNITTAIQKTNNSKKRNKSKKGSKTTHKPGNTPYSGIGDIPNGHRRANMKEALEQRQVRLYGLKKVDPKTLEANQNKETIPETREKLILRMVTLKAAINRNKKI